MHAATYAVSAVRYDMDGNMIRKVHLHELCAGWMGPPIEVERDQLLGAVESGHVVVALQRAFAGRHATAPRIRSIRTNGCIYLRCDDADEAADDLTGLPSF